MPNRTAPDDIDALAALDWLVAHGVDEAIGDAPVDRYTAKAAPEPVVAAGPAFAAPPTVRRAPPAVAPQQAMADVDGAAALANAANTLDELRAALMDYEGCSLKKNATNLVFADGNPAAPLMFVGEAPGRDEDLQGKPFVGVSGQLLDRMLKPLGLDRSRFYITNVLPWRPPDNREPALVEAAVCMPFLMRHIELVAPKVIVALGATAAKNVLQVTDGITRLRGKWFSLRVGALDIPTMATFHPAALLRNPINKRYVWRDLLAVTEKMEALGVHP